MYSTFGISQSSFSIGRVARSSTSRALRAGIETSTSTIGTLICGSSSRGRSNVAAAPSRIEVMTSSGVSLESMNARAMRPAIPRRAESDLEGAVLMGQHEELHGYLRYISYIGQRRNLPERCV